MRNKAGQMATIKVSRLIANEGRVVSVDTYIGYLEADEKFSMGSMLLTVPITDHYWWITCPGGLETDMGETSKAYAPDTWLEPIIPPSLKKDTSTDISKPVVKEDDLVDVS